MEKAEENVDSDTCIPILVQFPNEDVYEKSIGVCGRWQLLIVFLLFLCKFPHAWNLLSLIIITPEVDFKCENGTLDRCDKNCKFHVFDQSVFTNTVIMQWDLVCDRKYLAMMPIYFTYSGILFGSLIFGILADKFGRRWTLVSCVVVEILFSLLITFSPKVWIFCILRFFEAVAIGGSSVISYVIMIEIIGMEWRMIIAALYHAQYCLNHITLALIAYLLRDWRYMNLAVAVFSTSLLSYIYFMPESPRWLCSTLKLQETITLCEKAAKTNGIYTDKISEEIANYYDKKIIRNTSKIKLKMLLLNHKLRKNLILLIINSIICGLSYYGVSETKTKISQNIFVTLIFCGFLCLPGIIVSMWLTKIIGRKFTLAAANVITGIPCFVMMSISPIYTWINVFLSSFSIFGSTMYFFASHIYVMEIFPTTLRASALGLTLYLYTIGMITSKLILQLSLAHVYLIIGLLSILAAVLSLLLPETRYFKLPDTLEDVESFERKFSPLTMNQNEKKTSSKTELSTLNTSLMGEYNSMVSNYSMPSKSNGGFGRTERRLFPEGGASVDLNSKEHTSNFTPWNKVSSVYGARVETDLTTNENIFITAGSSKSKPKKPSNKFTDTINQLFSFPLKETKFELKPSNDRLKPHIEAYLRKKVKEGNYNIPPLSQIVPPYEAEGRHFPRFKNLPGSTNNQPVTFEEIFDDDDDSDLEDYRCAENVTDMVDKSTSIVIGSGNSRRKLRLTRIDLLHVPGMKVQQFFQKIKKRKKRRHLRRK